ncbi:eukaryotic translation initiation factor eIF2A-domain-containing protein [Lipomyces oligophaga]|uniref:eukaryotic translation initiation factor eIF2A-domain-containing protein n=1 Tax=Lipomyces oligophaga TaxID=45792 RepID=UPI0034CEB0FE
MTSVPQFFCIDFCVFEDRSSEGVGLVDTVPRYAEVADFQKPDTPSRTCCYSPVGLHFAYTTAENVFLVDSPTGKVLNVLDVPGVTEMRFSPQGNYIATFERPKKFDDGRIHQNFKVWKVSTGEKIAEMLQRTQNMDNFQFTADEKYCARLIPNQLQIFETLKLGSPSTSKLELPNISSFAISPGNNYYISTFVPDMKGKPAQVDVYNVLNLSRPLSSKKLFQADGAVMKWNNLGTSLLIWAQTEVDQTGKSYYGQSTLYLRGIAGNYDHRIDLDKEGSIHDVVWSPDSREFAVVYGYMPARTMFFNSRGETIRTLPAGPRNTVRYSNHGRYLLLAGFGNLQGECDIYDCVNNFKKIVTIDGSNSSVCEWSPDGRYILLATTSPRMRVDNGVKIFHISGKLVFVKLMNELFSVSWRPESPETYPLRSNSPEPIVHESAQNFQVKAAPKTVGAYRPPHARGGASSVSSSLFARKDEDTFALNAVDRAQQRAKARRRVPGAPVAASDDGNDGGISGAADDANLSKSALKNKKKRERKAKEAAEVAASGSVDSSVSETSVNVPVNGTANGSKTNASASVPPGLGVSRDGITFKDAVDEKKFRGLMKKLRAIEDLKMRQAGGEKLEDTQVKKIETEGLVKADLKQLGWTE